VTAERERHPVKQDAPSACTEEGIQIDESDEQHANAESPIRASREPDSNAMAERDVHPEKQPSQICSTEQGREMDASDAHP
jgi:hypothetical protein